MGQAGCPNHKGGGNGKDIQGRFGAAGIFMKAQFNEDLIKFG